MLNWKLAVLLGTLIVSGCNSNYKPLDKELKEVPVSHVNWPTSVSPCSSSLQVETRQFDQGLDGAVVVIPYQDYLNIQACNAAKLRYTNGLTSMVCFYRQDLTEKRCQYFYPTKKD